jgi:hypothetical protein
MTKDGVLTRGYGGAHVYMQQSQAVLRGSKRTVNNPGYCSFL